MPFSLGLYDLFTNIVPGFLYLYIIIELLQALGWRTINLSEINTFGGILIVTIASFILGNIFGTLTYNFWYRVFFKTHDPAVALSRIRDKYPDIQIDFKPDDNDLVFAVIRHHDKLLIEKLETSRVSSIMLRNISLGLLLYGVLEVWLAITRQQLPFLVLAVAAFIFSGITLRRSRTFYKWFYVSIFLEGLNYGSNAQEVLATSKKIVTEDIRGKMRLQAGNAPGDHNVVEEKLPVHE